MMCSDNLKTRFDVLRQGLPNCRVYLTLIFAVLSLIAVVTVSPSKAQWCVSYLGYYFILGIVIGIVLYTLQWAYVQRGRFFELRQKLWLPIAAVLIGSWVIFIHADLGYKIAMDDYALAGTAKGLHETRQVELTKLGKHWGDAFIPLETSVDKRPWSYPFVVSSVHDLFSYSELHPFAVNAVSCVLFLFLVYGFGVLLAGKKAGFLSVLLWATLPLLSQNATGAGMEMLNLLMLQLLLLLAVLYLKKPDANLEGMLSLVAVFLAYTRYESGIFILPTIFVIMIGWWHAGKVFLSWGTVLSSIALIAVAIQTRIYSETEASWEVSHVGVAPFGWDHLMNNFPNALNFFLSTDATLANSLLLGVLAVPAIVMFMVLLRTQLKMYWRSNTAGFVAAVFGVFILIQFAIILSFHAGQLDQRFVSRYSLPFHLLVVSALVLVIGHIAVNYRKIWIQSFGIVGLFILIVTMPSNSKAIFNDSNFVVREFNWLEKLVADDLQPRSLYIDDRTIFWALKEHTAVTPEAVAGKVEAINDYLENHNFKEAYLIRRATYRNQEFHTDLPKIELLESLLDLELVAEKSFRPLRLTQVYRIVGLKSVDAIGVE